MCLVAQISSLTSHRVAINSGFQINYALPFKLNDFYSPIYWARSIANVSSPIMNFFERFAKSNEKENENEEVDKDDELVSEDYEQVTTEFENLYETTTEVSTTEKTKKIRKLRMKRDLTAGQFYSGLRETMS